jgi:uncharacterized protein (TIGR03437 family)
MIWRILRLLPLTLAAVVSTLAQQPTATAVRQITALLSEKAARTAAQQKIDSHLLHAAAILRGRPVHPDFPAPPGELEAVRRDSRNYVQLDIRADVNADLLAAVRSLGGVVVNAFAEYHSIRASLPLPSVETLAERDDVMEIRIADDGYAGAGPDTAGDVAHQAGVARATLGYDGSGVKIGVMSDGVNSLATEQAAGRLPPVVNVIAGQAGNGDEGTAMLEIVYTLAPGATLYYATAGGGQANMANNIQLLVNAGCKIIIDDWTYFAEGVFQDDIIARKVNSLAAGGVLFFTDAQNSGSVLKGNSGTWEGDFLDSGAALPPIPALLATGGSMHNFGTAANVVSYDAITKLSPTGGFTGAYELKWSDPLAGSSNDYDLFILDPGMTTVLGSSTNVQNGIQNPEEHIPANSSFPVGARIVIVKHPAAAPRALHLDTERGTLAMGTTGATFGHNAASGAFTMAAVDAQSARGGAFTGGAANPSYFYTSDGPRRMFFNSDGTAVTPGDFLIATNGGTIVSKPNFTAADGVPTGVSGYTSFFGTSAAAPHAGAIAALALQAAPSLSFAGMSAAFAASALDIEGPGFDINSGAGIVMAPATISAALGGNPVIDPGGIVPLYSTSNTISQGSWISIYGRGLSPVNAVWNGDYPVTLGGVSVKVDGKSAYLSFVSSTQINLQVPDDTFTGSINVVVTTPSGSASSTATLASVAPSLNMFDSKHPAAVILTPDGKGAYAGGAYDYAGPSGVFPFSTRPVKTGETLLLYGTGFGPTNPNVPAGKPFSGSALTTNPVAVRIGNVPVTPISSAMYATGAYQIALVVPNAGSGDQPLTLTVAGAQTPANMFITLQ